MDTLLSLKVLAAVAEHKSFTYVAERFGLSPAMTSKHVKHVESRVGARLLNRNSRNVSLTEAGARYLATVKPLLEGLSEVETELSESTIAADGILKVSMPTWMANSSFARIVAGFHHANPKVRLDLDLSGRNINLVEEGGDLALRVSMSLNEGLIARKLGQVRFQLVASPEFIKSFRPIRKIEDLTGAPFLNYNLMGSSGRIKYGEGADAFDIRFSPVLHTGNENMIQLAAREGMGFAFLPHWLTINDFEKGLLESVLPDVAWPNVPLYAIYPDRSYLPAKVRCFLDYIAGPEGISKVANDYNVSKG